MNYWEVLGIKPTSDKEIIKKAFAEKSKTVHPEDHPEEFRQLHDAYKQAIKDTGSRRVSDDLQQDNHRSRTNSTVEYTQSDISAETENDEHDRDENADLYSEDEDAPEIFRILDEVENRKIRFHEELSAEFLAKADVISHSKNAGSADSWRQLFYDRKYRVTIMTASFINIITMFTDENKKLKTAYYEVLSEFYMLAELEDRTDKGPFTDLFVILKKRKKTPVMVRYKRTATPIILSVYLYIAITSSAVALGLPLVGLAAFIIPAGCIAGVFIKEQKLKRKYEAEKGKWDAPQYETDFMHNHTENSDEDGDRDTIGFEDTCADPDERIPNATYGRKPQAKAEGKGKYARNANEGINPISHIKSLRLYSFGTIQTACTLIFGGLYMVLAFNGTWAVLGSILMATAATIAVILMIITNIIVGIIGLIKKKKCRTVKTPLLFWTSLSANLILLWLILTFNL